jgi:hypothetical protein
MSKRDGRGKYDSGSLLMIGHRAQLQNGFGFELAYAFSRHIDLTANFGKGEWLLSTEAKP